MYPFPAPLILSKADSFGKLAQKEASNVEAGVVCSPAIHVNNRNPHPGCPLTC